MRTAPNKIEWTVSEINLLKKNWNKLTNKELFQLLNKPISEHSMRTKLYEMGLYKLELEFWTEEQVKFLKENYKKIGDTEIAEIFNKKYLKKKGWTKKHIEKKRRYLKLKRTPEELSAIREDWRRKGLYKESNRKMWITRGTNEIGTVVIWKGDKFIKTEKGYIHLRVFNYRMYKGEIPKGMMVNHIDRNKLNCNPENLQLLTRAENARRNSWSRYPEDYRKALWSIKKLNRLINKKQKQWQETN
ncbi:HNH endonuclease [Epilithonimonas vandammei]|uniref:HNH endonuclease n=1 Tax=Epilithonimonas vandammei TaxID=2487072 RepID=A0A3G8ZP30_9FLAO|nr:HNH endonuclease signature motif containing protein [Epilithonimonas vandammei]AZI53876.1 HNH endonuclease [Epilithonimonas vandammei]AZI55706.1 HNH endonuclease [Epilithonimonas vandammei]